MAYKAYVLFKKKNPNEFKVHSKRKRSKFLEKLAVNLINPCAQNRYERFETNSFSGCQSPVLSSFKKIQLNSPILNISPNRLEDKLETGKHCKICNDSFCEKII